MYLTCFVLAGQTYLSSWGMYLMYLSFVHTGQVCMSLQDKYVCPCRTNMYVLAGQVCMSLQDKYVCPCRTSMYVLAGQVCMSLQDKYVASVYLAILGLKL